jgi:PII-like signaling protein
MPTCCVPGSTRRILPFRVAAPSTLGTFLRSFTFGHVRQLDRVIALLLGRVWALGAGPGSGRLVIDIDSTITEVFGYAKQGAAYGYTRQKGYHPLVAARADTGEILHVRLRKGSSQKGAGRFVEELIARVRRAGAAGEILLRADAGFWSQPLIETLERLDVSYSITVKINRSIRARVEEVASTAWIPITYPDGGYAEVASLAYQTGRGQHGFPPRMVRLIVRRTRLVGSQAALFPTGGITSSSPTVTTRRDRRSRTPSPRRCRTHHQRPERRSRTLPCPLRALSPPTEPGSPVRSSPTT